jgi:hypothetical protein
MRTVTVDLSDDLASRLEAASKSRSVPPAEVVCELVVSLPPAAISERSAFEILGATFGRSESGLGNLSTNPTHLERLGR